MKCQNGIVHTLGQMVEWSMSAVCYPSTHIPFHHDGTTPQGLSPTRQDSDDLSPIQTEGAFSLTPEDITACISGKATGQAHSSMDEVWLSLTRHKMISPPGSPVAFPVPTASYDSRGRRTLYSPNAAEPSFPSPIHIKQCSGESVRQMAYPENDAPYIGMAN
ncbi:hypothetical protein PISMIDRAFT_18703 [Pisolithus microcarpus 441]|uniref:Unplaced genomic scaffold scaffold_393, whole genome shotgun sequence n=1 Tax=Pisolithus microcarpus 441 TaxID=765257 RepID=A0A0C9YF52_9AGAM|nr:hypothetical protein PISMIDRAFT_18703 [Pisolithus microcarpus 441]